MNRHQRRADVASFKREASRELLSYLVDAADARLAGEPLLSGAVRFWRRNIPTRRPQCFGCRAVFSDDGVQAGAFLLATPANAPTSASVSGLCDQCWRDLTGDEVEAVALRVLRKVMPRGRFA